MENFRKPQIKSKTHVSINNFIKFVTQSIILVGQTNIALSYHKYLSALDGVTKSLIQAKPMLKNKSELLKKIKIFLAKNFVSRYQKGTQKKLKGMQKSAVFKDASTGNQLFARAPPQENNIVGLKFLQKQQQAKELKCQLE